MTQYFAELLAKAAAQDLEVEDGRIFGQWLKEAVGNNARPYPQDAAIPWAANCLTSLARLFTLLESSGRYLEAARAEEIYAAGMRFLTSHLYLTNLAMQQASAGAQRSENLLMWVIRPKFHYAFHQLKELRETRLNFRHHHCFCDEDSM